MGQEVNCHVTGSCGYVISYCSRRHFERMGYVGEYVVFFLEYFSNKETKWKSPHIHIWNAFQINVVQPQYFFFKFSCFKCWEVDW